VANTPTVCSEILNMSLGVEIGLIDWIVRDFLKSVRSGRRVY